MSDTLQEIHDQLYSAVICDVLDSIGYKNQAPRIQFQAYTGINKIEGMKATEAYKNMEFYD